MMRPTHLTILIKDLAIRAHAGVSAIERRCSQTIVIDVEVQLANPVITRDHLSATVNYVDIVRAIEETTATERALLLETLAERIASRIFADAQVVEVALTITKPRKLPNCAAVGIRRVFHRKEATHGDTERAR